MPVSTLDDTATEDPAAVTQPVNDDALPVTYRFLLDHGSHSSSLAYLDADQAPTSTISGASLVRLRPAPQACAGSSAPTQHSSGVNPAGNAPTSPAVVDYRDQVVTHHGGAYVAPGRQVVAGAWSSPTPEQCHDDRPYGVWIGPPDRPAEQVLVCPTCGLDCT